MLTNEEIIALAKYEDHLRKAVESDFMRNPGREAIRLMDAIYSRAKGVALRSDPTCGVCILKVLKKIGTLYFEQKAKMEEDVKATAEKPKKRRKPTKE